MRHLNPSFKLISLIVVTIVLAGRQDPVWNAAAFFLSMILILSSGTRIRTLLLLLVPVALAAAGMFFTGYRFTADAALPVRSEAFISADSHVLNGITQASRVFAYAGIGYLFALTTDKIHMIRSFQRQLHLPQVFAYGLLAAWGTFPHMAMEYRKTRAAFRARGIRVFPASPALLAPLLVKSVRWSNELSSAMESKGFSPDAKRSEYSPVKVHLYDWIFLIFCCALIPVLSMIA